MSKKYKITVDGRTHIVEVEDYDGYDLPKIKEAGKEVVEENSTSDVKAIDKKNISPSENCVKAPLQGTLQEIKVNVGQNVKEGDILVIIEAMKMENEIVAPKDGKVSNIYVSKGSKVNAGDAIIELV